MAAFKEAGARKRSMTNGSGDTAYEQEKQREKEKEMMRQERIRERMPGRKPTGKAKAGDIDGKQFDHVDTAMLYCLFVC
jgi:exocyst complex component 4